MGSRMTSTLPKVAEHYRRMQIQTASHSKAICMLHEKCLQLIETASRKSEQRRENLDWAQNILAQLQKVLRRGDEVSDSLFLLYDYCYVLLEKGGKQECRTAQTIVRHLTFTFRALARRP